MIDIQKLRDEQIALAKKVIINNKLGRIRYVGGCDVVNKGLNDLICSIVILEFPSLRIVEKRIKIQKAPFAYMANYDGFRHGPIIVETYSELKQKPDVLFIRGHGISHPRRIGIASQMGLQLNVPTIGIAQKVACGKVQENKVIFKGEVIGVLVKTKEFAKPILVSPGHMISLSKALELTKETIRQPHKLPEPLFMAHKLAVREKKHLKITADVGQND